MSMKLHRLDIHFTVKVEAHYLHKEFWLLEDWAKSFLCHQINYIYLSSFTSCTMDSSAVTLKLVWWSWPTVSRPVSLGIGPPFGTLDQILSCSSSFVWQLRYSAFNASSLTRKRVCSLQCNHSLVRAVTPNNYTLPSHLRLCSLFVASYDSQGCMEWIIYGWVGGGLLFRCKTPCNPY
jgi:hypothetical protein